MRDVAAPTEPSTFVFADLAGYTALTDAHGDARAAEVATAFCRSATALAEEYGGEHVKSIGDAVLLRFGDAGQAVHLAARLVNDLGGRHEALGVGVGMHTGTAVLQDGDWFGAAVNIAARLADAAGPGEVLLSGETRRAAGPSVADSQVRGRGVQELRNVARPVQVLELVAEGRLSAHGLPVDPVCRMAVDPGSARETARHRGSVLVFCSPECRRAFLDNPAAYGQTGPARPSWTARLRRRRRTDPRHRGGAG